MEPEDWSFLEFEEGSEEEWGDEGEELLPESPAVTLLNRTVQEAVKRGASHLHVEPEEEGTTLRLRIDGVLTEVGTFPKQMERVLVGRIKVIANLDLTERRLPQTGGFELSASEKTRVRVHTAPTLWGEEVTLSFATPDPLTRPLDELGLSPQNQQAIQRLLKGGPGLVLLAGPTGSGKGTLLRSLTVSLRDPGRKLLTIERPVRGSLPGVRQMEVNAAIGLDTERLLASARRQDADVLMTTALETAEACRLALDLAAEGCLVLAGMPTGEAVSTMRRLIDMGLTPEAITTGLKGVIGLRLVRGLCEQCREPYEPVQEELEALGLTGEHLREGKLAGARGCPQCHDAGYVGRIGIHEVLEMDASVRTALWKPEDHEGLDRAVRETGLHTLLQDGARKVADGLTTSSEVLRAVRSTIG